MERSVMSIEKPMNPFDIGITEAGPDVQVDILAETDPESGVKI